MGRKNRETTEAERNVIIRLHNQYKSIRNISQIVGIPRMTVWNVIERFGALKTVKNRPRSGRPSLITDRVKRKITKKVAENPRISASQMVSELEQFSGISVSVSTIRNVLHKSGYNGRVPRKKFWVSEKNKKIRLEFAVDNQNKGEEFWNRGSCLLMKANSIFLDRMAKEKFGEKRIRSFYQRI